MDEQPEGFDPNVQADETTIYEGGKLSVVRVEHMIGNEHLCRTVLNRLNLALREVDGLRPQVEDLRIRQAGYDAHPRFVLAFMNVAGLVLIGLSINYLSSVKPAPNGITIPVLLIGCLLCFLSTAKNAFPRGKKSKG